jgi:regulator of replication initiation timing
MTASTDESSALLQSVRALQGDAPSVAAAAELLASLRRDVASITPEALAMFAIRRSPRRGATAVAALGEQLGKSFRDLVDLAAKIAKAVEEDRGRLGPLLHEAAVRHMHNEARIADTPRMIESARGVPEISRKPLRAAGYSRAQVVAMVPDADVSHLVDEAARLTVENAALRAFLDTHDESCLPVGFAVTPPPPRMEFAHTMPFIAPPDDFEAPVVQRPHSMGA